MGPNQKRLIAVHMGNSAVPSGGGLRDALRFLTNRESIRQAASAATAFVEQAIALVRTAPDNPYTTDEEICAELLRRVEARKGTSCPTASP